MKIHKINTLTEISLPDDAAGLTIDHNPHLGIYETAAEWLSHKHNREQYDWSDDEAVARAIESNEFWTMQWYPSTPISFHAIAAPTLAGLLHLAKVTE